MKKQSFIKKAVALAAVAAIGLSAPGDLFGEGLQEVRAAGIEDNLDTKDWGSLKITYDTPPVLQNRTGVSASDKDYQGIPIGNGHLGARIDGLVAEENYRLNDKNFWSGDPKTVQDYSGYSEEFTTEEMKGRNTGGLTPEKRIEAYKKAQELLVQAFSEGTTLEEQEELIRQADETAFYMKGTHNAMACYLPIGEMKISISDHENYTNYKNILDLDGATNTIQYEIGDTTYTRTSFASYPDDVMVVQIESNDGTSIDMDISLELPDEQLNAKYESGNPVEDNKVTVDKDRNEIVMTGRAPYLQEIKEKKSYYQENRGITFESRVKVSTENNEGITLNEDSISVNSDEITLIYSSKTTYKDPFTDPTESGIDTGEYVKEKIDSAAEKGYDALLETHQADYREMFRTLWIELGGTEEETRGIPAASYGDYYQYSRYIMISASRANGYDRPAMGQDMWCHDWIPESNGAHFLNEQIEKKYALIEAANIADTGDPLWKWLENMSVNGEKTAQQDFGLDGWAVGHFSDIWCSTILHGSGDNSSSGARAETNSYAVWSSGGLWIMNTLYDHYAYGKDIEFLKEYYPVLEGAVEFALGNLMRVDGVEGELKNYWSIVGPSTSPEDEFRFHADDGKDRAAVGINTASDVWIYSNLFNIVMEAAEELENAGMTDIVNDDVIAEVQEKAPDLVPIEMLIDDETGTLKEYYNDFTPDEADHRHNSHLVGVSNLNFTGFSELNMPEVYDAAQKAIIARGSGGVLPDVVGQAARLGMSSSYLNRFQNLVSDGFDYGNYGKWGPLGSGVAEMLLDSRNGELNILAYLPEQWTSGEITGIRARDNYELSIKWDNGELVSCEIESLSGYTPVIRYQDHIVDIKEDDRFTLIRKEKLDYDKMLRQAEERLAGGYTEESLADLQEAVESGEYDAIQKAIDNLIPVVPKFKTLTDESSYTCNAGDNFTLDVQAVTDRKVDGKAAEITYKVDEKYGEIIQEDGLAYLSWTPTTADVGTHEVTIKAADGNDSVKATVNITVKTADVTDDELIVNTTDAGYKEGGKGTWKEDAIKGYNDTVTRINPTNGAEASWTVTIPETGTYEVYRWSVPDSTKGSQKVELSMEHAGGTWSETQNWRTDVSGWVKLGEFDFNALTETTLTAKSTYGGNMRTSAVKFVKKSEGTLPQEEKLLINNEDGLPYYEEIKGEWMESNGVKGHDGSGTKYSLDQYASAEWHPVVAEAGSYQVRLYHPVHQSDVPNDVRIEILTEGGSVLYTKDYIWSSSDEAGWIDLGNYELVPGQYTIKMSKLGEMLNENSDKHDQALRADAVELIRKADVEEPVDKTRLQSAVTEAEEILKNASVGDGDGQYPQAAADALSAAVETAKGVLEAENMTQKQLDDAVETLKLAMTEFENSLITSKPEEVDFSGLNQAIADAEELLRTADPEKYPETALKAFEQAISTAKESAGNPELSQEEVNQAQKTLEDAMEEFLKAMIEEEPGISDPGSEQVPEVSGDEVDQGEEYDAGSPKTGDMIPSVWQAVTIICAASVIAAGLYVRRKKHR